MLDPILARTEERYPDLAGCMPAVQAAFETIAGSLRAGGKLLVCGNGGSASDSEHIVGELMKGFNSRRPLPPDVARRFADCYGPQGTYLADRLQGALPAIALVSQTSLSTAYGNDVAADMASAQQVFGYGRPGDVLLGISTSGNARNVIHALQVAHVLGLRTVGLTGPAGGAMAACCDVLVRAPGGNTAEIQERHLPVYHALCAMLEETFFGR